jgi:hypothetical protein
MILNLPILELLLFKLNTIIILINILQNIQYFALKIILETII